MTREEAIDIIRTSSITFSKDNENAMLELSNGLRSIEALNMAIEALEHPHGRFGEWVDDEPDVDDWSYKKGNMPRHCSACGHRAGKYKYKTYKFCPWCGADMRGGTNGKAE